MIFKFLRYKKSPQKLESNTYKEKSLGNLSVKGSTYRTFAWYKRDFAKVVPKFTLVGRKKKI